MILEPYLDSDTSACREILRRFLTFKVWKLIVGDEMWNRTVDLVQCNNDVVHYSDNSIKLCVHTILYPSHCTSCVKLGIWGILTLMRASCIVLKQKIRTKSNHICMWNMEQRRAKLSRKAGRNIPSFEPNSIVIFSARLKLYGQMSWFLYYEYWAMLHINMLVEDQELIFETVFIYLYVVYTNKKWYLRQYLFTFILCIQMLPWHASIYCFKSLSWKNNNNNRKSH